MQWYQHKISNVLTSVGSPSSSNANANEYVPVLPYPTPTTLRPWFDNESFVSLSVWDCFWLAVLPPLNAIIAFHPLSIVFSINHFGWPIPTAIPELCYTETLHIREHKCKKNDTYFYMMCVHNVLTRYQRTAQTTIQNFDDFYIWTWCE